MRSLDPGGTLTITLKDAKKKLTEARKESIENLVRKRWYKILVSVLEVQQHTGEAEPDFSAYWINANHELLLAASEYYEDSGHEIDTKDNYELIAEMVKSIIGDELEEYDLSPKFFPVYGGFESAVCMYFLKPGQAQAPRVD